MTEREHHFMQAAIGLARKGMQNGHGGPFGCVIVHGNEIVGEGFNCVTSANDPTAHAEVVAIREACSRLQTFQLSDCELYTSCEPCPMCLGAIYWARLQKIYFAASRHDAADAGFDDSFIYDELVLPLAGRKIPMLSFQRAQAVEVFEEWKKWPGKISY